MKRIFLISMAFAATALMAKTTDIVDQPKWSLKSLGGVRSNHDGANCFNGVAAALGYVDHLTHTDGIELRYFLEFFCRPNGEKPQAGDVLTVLREDTLEHGAIFVENGKIFDKNSIAGFLGRYDDKADSFYRTKFLTESQFFNQCRAPDCVVKSYTCPSHSSVRPQMRRCVEVSNRFGITALRKTFQKITLSPKQKFSLGPDAYSWINLVIRSIEDLNGDEECALYLLVSGSSIVGQLWNLNEESNLGPSWIRAIDSLRTALKNAKERLLQYDKSEKTARILREGSWLPKEGT